MHSAIRHHKSLHTIASKATAASSPSSSSPPPTPTQTPIGSSRFPPHRKRVVMEVLATATPSILIFVPLVPTGSQFATFRNYGLGCINDDLLSSKIQGMCLTISGNVCCTEAQFDTLRTQVQQMSPGLSTLAQDGLTPRIGGFGFGVLINEILELELRVLRETNGRAEKLQEMRVVLAKLVGKVVRVGFLCALRMKVSNCSADMG
ncbi:hypothetical protein VitviT2T_017061 [Vitis vinifera]|uniref:Uncharacterized protein n=1 Tax=Vitis vinifera TaxID=29760 RepID=A0ABY9CVH5_VITVI|nr:hypothetical protein VitviT2T_017061 [Vitis vinifera]